MELQKTLRALRQNLVLIIVAAVVGALGGLGAALLSPTTYTSETDLFVSIPGAGSATDLQQGSTFTQERLQTYVEMVDSRSVLSQVIEDLDLDETTNELARRVRANSDPQTVLISIEMTDTSPQAAATIVEAVAERLVEVVTELENPSGTGASPVQLSVANPADVSPQVSSLSTWLEVLLGAVVGTVLGIGIALVRSTLDNKLRTKEHLRQITQAPLLATVPADPMISRSRLITDVSTQGPRAEAFRKLRTNLRYAQVNDTSASVLVTSSLAGEGKTLTSINLAIVMAQAGQRVALVDSDLRRPGIADQMGIENAAGLTTALLGAADVTELMQAWGDDELYVLAAGEIPPNPTELLDSRAMDRIFAQLTAEFDLVIFDGPPLLPVADGLILARYVGRVLLVAGVGQVRIGEAQEAVHSLAMVDAERIGVVFNKAPVTPHVASGYASGYTYGDGPQYPPDWGGDGGAPAGEPARGLKIRRESAPSDLSTGPQGLYPPEPVTEVLPVAAGLRRTRRQPGQTYQGAKP